MKKTMTVNEFIANVQARQEILLKLKKTKNRDNKIFLLSELIKIQDKFLDAEDKTLKFKEREIIVESKIASSLRVCLSDISMLSFSRKYLKNIIGEAVSAGYTCYDNYYNVKVESGKKYNLFELDGSFVYPKMLYSAKYERVWDKFFEQDPKLKEKLWQWAKENVINRDKKYSLSLIQKRIQDNNKKVSNLSSEEYLNKTINDLNKENESLQKEQVELENNLDELTF